ncbi:MAG: GNAT family N-acetyltransferase [Rhizobiales bacterium]|nr:GNAT family N-acetyltransferase [Hyphomicrobiales bacterium]
MPSSLSLRPYKPADEPAVIELWRQTWQSAYPTLDFKSRLTWWRERWEQEIVPHATIIIADFEGQVIGFVTIDQRKGYLDQIVVMPKAWGSQLGAALMAEAKRLSPQAIYLHVNQDNKRAIRFYQKHGFVIMSEDVNRRSGLPVYSMLWKGAQPPSN